MLPVLALLAGCQTYSGGMAVICDAPNECEPCRMASADTKLALTAHHIDQQLWNPSARRVFEALAMAAPESRGAVLRAAAAESGLSSCALADVFDASVQPEPAPEPLAAEAPKSHRARVQDTLRGAMAQVRYCYEKQLARDPALEGQVILEIAIAPDGTVTSVDAVESSFATADVPDCVRDVVRRLSFPASSDASLIRYPFVFSASAPEE